jgi:hypothetical protein
MCPRPKGKPRLYSVMVSTSDSDSGNLGSIPGTTFFIYLFSTDSTIKKFFETLNFGSPRELGPKREANIKNFIFEAVPSNSMLIKGSKGVPKAGTCPVLLCFGETLIFFVTSLVLYMSQLREKICIPAAPCLSRIKRLRRKP